MPKAKTDPEQVVDYSRLLFAGLSNPALRKSDPHRGVAPLLPPGVEELWVEISKLPQLTEGREGTIADLFSLADNFKTADKARLGWADVLRGREETDHSERKKHLKDARDGLSSGFKELSKSDPTTFAKVQGRIDAQLSKMAAGEAQLRARYSKKGNAMTDTYLIK